MEFILKVLAERISIYFDQQIESKHEKWTRKSDTTILLSVLVLYIVMVIYI